ncbi:DUF3800 domain-containing protein [Rubinisphaera sp. JC750]|uniref:DUF3800 domain-containing protein n=1 Tax=Rubinisphaera sp. JC750 TaxID=2898658 RepID=UPI001F1EAE5C|nr:DUF3800 domain-containing protein [Rubinisphaera sp. JC750]
MSWLLFLDESGHDHKQMPYEVRGGVALQDSQLWPFVQAMQRLELDCFGGQLHLYRKELKGSTLLDRKRFKFANQAPAMPPDARRKHSRGFLTKGLEKKTPTRDEFTAYGQACLEMARGTFQLLRDHQAVLFASVIPASVKKPDQSHIEEYLRKDHVFLQERFFYFLEAQRQHGLLVMDEIEKSADRKFVRQIEAYFTRTATGRHRTAWIVPTPFFVSSDMTYPVQAADLCIYCLNWGFRLPSLGMNAPVREEIGDEFGPWLNQLQFSGEGEKDGRVFSCWGVVYVQNPYAPGRT